MSWKQQLEKLERQKEWDTAILLMQKAIKQNPNNIDTYLYMNYLLMNFLVEEDYNFNDQPYYADLCKKYFNESFNKFSGVPEYLFFTGITASMSEWFFGIDIDQAENLQRKAHFLDPNNLLYQWIHYIYLDPMQSDTNKKSVLAYAAIIRDANSAIKNILLKKGSLGRYVFTIMHNWSSEMIALCNIRTL